MNPNFILAIVTIFLSAVEAIRNYFLIEQENKSPHNWKTYLLRTCIYIALIIIFPHLIAAVTVPFISWFSFNVILNRLRKKPLGYFGKEGIDKYLGRYPLVSLCVEAMLFMAALAVSAYGWCALVNKCQ